MKLKIGDKIKCKYFAYIRKRDLHGVYTYMIDYREGWYNPDGTWYKAIIPREEMEGVIMDDPSNANAIFEVVDIENEHGGRIHNDVIDPYVVYKLKKLGDDTYPIISIASSGIDTRSFDLDLVEIIN